jgi:hypothetical protein
MNKRILTIILGVVLIASFFLPLFSGVSISGFDMVKAPGSSGNIDLMVLKYIWIIFPLSGLMLLIGAANNGNYFLGRGLWAWLPLLAVIYIIVRPVIEGEKIGDMIKSFGVGFWVIVVASLVAAIYNPKV